MNRRGVGKGCVDPSLLWNWGRHGSGMLLSGLWELGLRFRPREAAAVSVFGAGSLFTGTHLPRGSEVNAGFRAVSLTLAAPGDRRAVRAASGAGEGVMRPWSLSGQGLWLSLQQSVELQLIA